MALLLALAGCTAEEATQAAAIMQQTGELPSKTPRPTFTPVATSTPAPSATVIVAATPRPSGTPTPSQTATPTRPLDVSPLTGLRVADLSLLHRRVLAARIGNDPVIRPQDGLGQADVVYEEIMDGWTVTRFTALYLDQNVERMRPVRSARLSSLAIVPQYEAALVHSGASDHIRWLISQASFVDLDEYFHPEPYSIMEGYDWRGRMYTSVERIHEYLVQNGLEHETLIEGYTFDPLLPEGQEATAVHIPYPTLCVVDWRYKPDSGRYLRWVQGEPHLEGLTQEQIAADNVVVFYAEHKKTDIVEDSLGSTAIDIVMEGSGRAQVFRDGLMVEGRWVQEAPGALVQFYDGEGDLIPLRPGRTWIQLVPLDYDVRVD